MVYSIPKPIGHLIGANLEVSDDVARFAVGTTVELERGGKAIYVKASTAITGEGYAAIVDEDYFADMVTITNSNGKTGLLIGWAQCAIAAGDYGWLVIEGETKVRALTLCAAFAALNVTATAGCLDDDATAGSAVVENAVLTTAIGGATANAVGRVSGTARVLD